ncbi:chromosome segregation protein SMC [Candidatus Pacearchaeota archaeon]|nr:chromosome segregation protein SMC [Candidatus Pacearchaeota archaeon]
MVYVKKLVMQGFKSFAKRTEIIFSMGVNCILGANGSGKSNIADAICFVLGRRSIKSMRAARARNLIFMGSKYIKPSREAFVEIIFDNTDRGFNIDKDEVHIRRTVRVNGQSIYKLNGEIKTSAEILETLAQAGIDPYGFNLILQGQIQSIVRMHSEDRRKIIEEVSGIAVYESRKKKALHELEKTDEKLKEIGAILRERGIFLRNLEKEKEQAEKYNELQSTVKRAKATILHKRSEEKKREIHSILKSIQDKNEQKEKIINRRKKVEKDNQVLDEKINGINKEIQRATGVEQGELQEQIVNLKSEIEGLKVRKENYENKKTEIERRIEQVSNSIPELEQEIEELKKESPITAKKAAELKEKKNELTIIEEERKKLIAIESELNSIKERKNEKERQIAKTNAESESLLRQIEEELSKLNHKTEDECIRAIQSQKEKLIEKNKEITGIEKAQIENEKIVSVSDFEIKRLGDIKNKLDNIDVCPLCQTKITGDHVKHVFNEADEGIEIARKKKEKANEEITRTMEIKHKLANEIKSNEESITRLEFELNKHKNAKEKQERLKKIVEEEKVLKNELKRFEEKRINLEKAGEGIDRIEEQYHKKMLEIEEISSRNDENIDNLLLYKQRDLESFNTIIKQSKKGLKEVEEDIEEITSALDKKIDVLDEKEKQEEELTKRFNKMFQERDKMQKEIHNNNIKMAELQNEIRAVEEQANYLKIGKAKADAELDATNMELSEFAGVELLQGSIQHLEERLRKAQESLLVIGNINMRALQVYQEVKKEYDIVQDKAGTIEKEKIEILKIIEEVDKKKTREFMKTFKGINALFSENFAKLSAKGHAYLEIENQEDIFAGGINIIVKLAKGKYFDVTSLSGGEQTLVALSLLFAIQEFKPYHFYIFDEIDAALDKRNSERLAALLNQYMKSGQYIVITHNDAIILNNNLLYGASMQEGVSKVLSWKVSRDNPEQAATEINKT